MRKLPWVALVSALVIATPAVGVMVSVQMPMDLYGRLENDGPRCASTAIINSFVYLQNRYPGYYDQALVPDTDGDGEITLIDMDAARDQLHQMILDNGGAYSGVIWEQKIQWFIDKGLDDVTIFKAMSGWADSSWVYPQWVDSGWPSWEFLWTELNHGEDVEISFIADDAPEGHCVTLTSMRFDDLDGDNVWDPDSEDAWIDYLDPNDPDGPDDLGSPYVADLDLGTDGKLFFRWQQGNPVVRIESAFSESPIPEPLTAACILLTLAGLGRYAKRRSRWN